MRFFAAIAVVVLSCPIVANAQEPHSEATEQRAHPPFSADLVMTWVDGTISKDKLYVTGLKSRSEDADGSYTISDYGTGKTYRIYDTKCSVISMSPSLREDWTQVPVQINKQNLCSLLNSVIHGATTKKKLKISYCRVVGVETMNGRSTIKATDPTNGDVFWVDPQLHEAIRYKVGKITFDYQNIREAPQSPELFEPPSKCGR